MKTALLGVVLAFVGTCLVGCSPDKKPIAPADNGAPPPKDSGAGVDASGKKGPRIPGPEGLKK